VDEEDLDELILDNAFCRMAFAVGLKKMAIAVAVFPDNANGYPLNSPDCMLLDASACGRFNCRMRQT
jgi:hypothetical protein